MAANVADTLCDVARLAAVWLGRGPVDGVHVHPRLKVLLQIFDASPAFYQRYGFPAPHLGPAARRRGGDGDGDGDGEEQEEDIDREPYDP